MSIVENHDIVQMGINLRDEKRRCAKILENANRWQDVPGTTREEIMSSQHAQMITRDRRDNCMCMDHVILDKREFRNEWAIDFGTRTCVKDGVVLKNTRKMFRKAEGNIKASYIPINPMEITGFANMRNIYQYFQMIKVSVKFSSNQSANFSPIFCKYLTPGNTEQLDRNPEYLAQLTKSAITTGGNGYLSVIKPRAAITVGNADKGFEFRLPFVTSELLECDFDSKMYKFDFGSLVFISRNQQTQSFLATVEYKVDFYSGLDYTGIPWTGIPLPDGTGNWGDPEDGSDGEGDGGQGGDDHPGDGGDGEGDGSDGEGDGSGSGSGCGNPSTTSAKPSGKVTRIRNRRG